MDNAQVVDVARVIDDRKIDRFSIVLVVVSTLITLFDGYDIGVISFAGPDLIKHWNVAPAAMAPVFSAGPFGMAVGGLLFGYLGDMIGRKRAIAISAILFGIFTGLVPYATSLEQVMAMRFLAGLGIGGAVPNIVVLNGEFAPRRVRATLAIIALSGLPIGAGVPGLLQTAWLAPGDWQSLFLFGGIVPLVLGVVAYAVLPESLKYLSLRPARRADLLALLKRLRPDLQTNADTRFVIADEKQYRSMWPTNLFADGLALITPLFWLLVLSNLLGYFFLMSWMPTLMQAADVAPGVAARALLSLQVGGTIGTFVLCRPMDRYGMTPIVALFAMVVPLVASFGYLGTISPPLLMIAMFFAGFGILGVQNGLNVIISMIYPTSLRANGTGWALGVGRIGAIAGPLLGPFFIGMSLTSLYLWTAVPFAVALGLASVLWHLVRERKRAQAIEPVKI